jgi:hypothetical protein
LVSAIGGGLIQGWFNRDVEADKNRSLITIETRKVDANIALEKQKQESTEKLERAKFETELIMKAIEAPKREEQIRNLKFFLTAGFISDPGGKIANMNESAYPSPAPPASAARADTILDRMTCELPSSSSLEQITKEFVMVLSAPPLGLSVFVQSPNVINFRKYQKSDVLTGFFESVNIMLELLPKAPEPGFWANLMLGQRYVAQSPLTGSPLPANFREMTPDQSATYGAAVLKAFNAACMAVK